MLLKALADNVKASVPLTVAQNQALEAFRTKLRHHEYEEVSHPCLCGGNDDVLVGYRDRYGLDVTTLICKSCGLLRTDPYLSEDSLERFYRDDYRAIYEDAENNGCDALARMIVQGKSILQFFKQSQIKVPDLVVEIGCGTGGNLVPFLLAGHVVKGCDYGVEFLDIGRKLSLDLRAGGFETMQLSGVPVLIILCHVLEHFRDPQPQMQALRSGLEAGSLVYVELPGIFSIGKSYERIQDYFQNAHSYHFCLTTLDYLMSQCGMVRVCGNERIQAVYQARPDVVPLERNAVVWNEILSHLHALEVSRQRLSRRFARLCALYMSQFARHFD